jgi:hypothetical protein
MVGRSVEIERWAGTALFYSGLHFTEAVLRRKGAPQATSHEGRLKQVVQHFDNAYLQHYIALKDLSEGWRYYGRVSTTTDLQAAHRGDHAHVKSIATKMAAPTI